ncbi:hypothetical protein PM082_021519 [Marasmius tenuissimus]|nr:hypothetical protein PM082_021519 [Marasmius tenuissimus]
MVSRVFQTVIVLLLAAMVFGQPSQRLPSPLSPDPLDRVNQCVKYAFQNMPCNDMSDEACILVRQAQFSPLVYRCLRKSFGEALQDNPQA